MFIVSALSNMATWNQASWDPKMQPFCKLGVLVHCLARTRKSPTIPRHVNAIALHVFVIVTVKLQQFVMNDQIFHHQSRVVTDSTSWDYPACIRDTLWRQHYVRTSKEYLINCHILLQYFELVFLQLQLVQILFKLIIIWVNCVKKQKEVILWNTV